MPKRTRKMSLWRKKLSTNSTMNLNLEILNQIHFCIFFTYQIKNMQQRILTLEGLKNPALK
jgi:hypothetical protein